MNLQSVKELKAKGAYSLAVQDGGTIYISGQLPIDLETGALRLGTAKEETELILNNMEAILQAYGADRNNLRKLTVFMTAASYWDEINAAFSEFFIGCKPARSCVVVGEVPFMGFKVEIEAIASLGAAE